MLMNSQDADLFGKNFCQDLPETVKIPDKHNYKQTRPFRSGSSHESARCGERKNFFKMETSTKIK